MITCSNSPNGEGGENTRKNYLSQRQCVRNNVIALDNNLAALILGIVLAASGIVCIFLANYQYWELRFEVNDRLPEGQKFEPLFWSPVTNLKFRRLHRAVLPESPRPKRALRFAVVGFVLLFSGIALVLPRLGFISGS
jgi:hypothetical protein